MPILWFTGFNGAGHKRQDTNLEITNTDSYTNMVTKAVENYIGRMYGRMGNGAGQNLNAPFIRAYGRRWANGTYGGFCHGWVEPAKWDTSSSALTLGMTKTGSASIDINMGVCFQPPMGAGGKSWRIGFRLYQCTPTIFNSIYALNIADVASSPSPFVTQTLGRETPYYFEIEWDSVGRKVTVYRDGALLIPATAANLTGGVGIYTEMYYTGSATAYFSPWVQIGDMYWQTIESDADTALGPGTIVKNAFPSQDDEVSFTRPSTWNSNAVVVQVPTSSVYDGKIIPATADRFLTGAGAGAQDLYGIDLTNVTSTMARVEAVSVRSVAGNPGTTPMTFDVIAKSGAVQVDSGEGVLVAPNSTYYAKNTVLTADPADGARWTIAKLANLKIGTKIIS